MIALLHVTCVSSPRIVRVIQGMIRPKLTRLLVGLLLIAATPLVAHGESGDEESAKEYFKLGNEYFKARLYKKAVESYEQCLEKDTDHKEAWYNLGAANAKLRKF